jgi:hypothetical protein
MMEKDDLVVSFLEQEVANGNYTPSYKGHDSFLVYQETMDTREHAEDLPFAIPKTSDPKKLVVAIEQAGYRYGSSSYPELGFYSLWAAPIKRVDKCLVCKSKLKEKLLLLIMNYGKSYPSEDCEEIK